MKFSNLKLKTISVLISFLFVLSGVKSWGQGSETFNNICTSSCSPSSSSYGTRTWTGDNGQSWTATDARTDQTINNAAITIRNGALTFGLTTTQSNSGIGSLTLNAKAPFGSPDIGTLQLVINGTTISTKTTSGSTTSSVVSYTWSNINISNPTSIVINQTTSGSRITIDDITWTSYSATTNYYWNGSNNTALSSTWNTSSTNWTTPTATATPNTAWTDGASNVANFLNTSGGTITIPANRQFSQVNITNTSGNAHIFSTANGGSSGYQLNGPIALTSNSVLQMPVDNSATNDATLDLLGNVSGASGSSITLRSNVTSSTNNSRLNLAATGITFSVPTVNITGAGNGLAGFVATSGTSTVSSNIVNNSTSITTMLGATSGNTLNFSGILSGSRNLQFSAGTSGGAGTIVLSGANTYSGGNTYFNLSNGGSGIVRLGASNTLPTSTNLVFASTTGQGGSLQLYGFNQTVGSISQVDVAGSDVISNGASTASTLTITQSTNNSISIPFTNGSTGTLAVIKNGTGVLTATGIGANYTFTGGLTISAGEWRWNPTTSNVNIAVPVTLNGGTLSTTNIAASRNVTLGTINLSASSTLALGGNSTNTLTFSSGTGTWSGTLTITGWTGTNINGTGGSNTTGPKIFIGTSATTLTAAQLASIQFSISGNNYSAVLLSTGELVPTTATKLAFTVVPTSAVPGGTFSVTVQSQDANNNPAIVNSATSISLSANFVSGTSGTFTSNTGTIPVNSNNVTIGSLSFSTAATINLTASRTSGQSLTSGTSSNISIAYVTSSTDYFRSNVTTGNWGTASSWQSSPDSTNWITSSQAPTSSATAITIQSGHNITVASSASSNNLTITGTLTNQSTLTQSGTTTVNGTYNHSQNGGTIITATWGASSNCNITGMTSTAPTGLAQSFGNFTWNCGSQSTFINISSNSFVCKTLTVSSTGSSNLSMGTAGPFTNTIDSLSVTGGIFYVTFTLNNTLNVNNGVSVSGGTLGLGGSSGLGTLNISGNLNISGGTLDFGAGSGNGTINLAGNLNQTAGIITTSVSGTNGIFVFNGSSSQTLTLSTTPSYTNFRVNNGATVTLGSNISLYANSTASYRGQFTVGQGTSGILNVGTFNIISSGSSGNPTFTLSAGATLQTNNTGGIEGTASSGSNGSIAISNLTRSYSPTANYVLNGATTTPFPSSITAMNNLTLGANVTLNRAITVSNTLNLSTNTLTTNTSNITFSSITGTGSIYSDNATYLTCSGTNGTAGTLRLASGGQSVAQLVMNRTGQTLSLGSNIIFDGFLDPTNAGRLLLTAGVLDASGDQLTFINGNTPISVTSGTLTTSNTTSLIFGTSGNTGGSAFTLPAGIFTISNPVINNLTVNRTNALTLNNQGLYIQNGALTLSAGNLNLGSSCTLELNAANLSVTSGTLTGSSTSDFTVSGTSGNTVTLPVAAITLRNVSVNGTRTLALSGTNNLTLAGALTIASGATFDNGGTSQIVNGGTPSISINGTFITRHPSGFFGTGTSIPSITTTLNTGSTVEFGAIGNQTINGAVDYVNLTVSGSGTKTPSSATTVSGLLTISGSAILDASNATIGGTGTNLTMTGTSKFIVGGTSGTRPLITGTYNLSNTSTIEFAGSGVTIRQGSPILYGNIDISGSSVTAPLTGITLQNGSTFTVKNGGTLNVNSTSGLYSASNAAVLSTNTPTISLATGSTINYGASGNQNISNTTPYSNITISGSGTKTASAAFTVNGTFTQSGSATLGTTSPTYGSGATLAYVDATASQSYTSGLEWPTSNAPTNVTVNLSGTGNTSVILNNSKTVTGVLTLTAGKLSIGSNTLTLAGTVSGMNANNSLTGGSNSNLTISSTSTVGTIFFDQSTLANNVQNTTGTNLLNNLTINGTNSITILGNSLAINTVLNVQAGTLNLNNNLLVLKSTASGTASVDVVGTGATISNATNVTVERFKTGSTRRVWLLATTPLSASGATTGYVGVANATAGSIFGNWQQGTYITGNIANGTAGGLDAGAHNNWGILSWGGTKWNNVTNTTNAYSLFNNTGGATADNNSFFVFVRGDRNVTPSAYSGQAATATLSANGTLQQGNKTQSFTGSTYALVGNPYPAPINLESFRTANGNVQGTFYYWDPSINANGGYVTCISNGSGSYTKIPSGGASVSNQDIYIQSGQAFFIMPTSGSTVNYTESMKSTANSSNTVFGQNGKASTIATFGINLFTTDTTNTYRNLDGIAQMYHSSFSSSVNTINEDAAKFYGGGENLAIQNSGVMLSVEKTQMPQANDTVRLNIKGLKTGFVYDFKPDAYLMPASLQVYVFDKYLNQVVQLDWNNTQSKYSFTIDSNLPSKAADRFALVFKTSTTLSSSAIQLTAKKINNTNKAQLTWQLTNVNNVSKIVVEKRSSNDSSFKEIGSLTATSLKELYTYVDAQLFSSSLYRIKVMNYDGQVSYSNTAYISVEQEGANQLVVSPNPIINHELKINTSSLFAGKYTISIINTIGEVIVPHQIVTINSQANIALKQNLTSGLYFLQYTSSEKNIQGVLPFMIK